MGAMACASVVWFLFFLEGVNVSLYFFDIDPFSSRRSLIALVYLISASAFVSLFRVFFILLYVLVIQF